MIHAAARKGRGFTCESLRINANLGDFGSSRYRMGSLGRWAARKEGKSVNGIPSLNRYPSLPGAPATRSRIAAQGGEFTCSAGKDDQQPLFLQGLAKLVLEFFPRAIAEEVLPGELRFLGRLVFAIRAIVGFQVVNLGEEMGAVPIPAFVHEIPAGHFGGSIVAPTALAIGVWINGQLRAVTPKRKQAAPWGGAA